MSNNNDSLERLIIERRVVEELVACIESNAHKTQVWPFAQLLFDKVISRGFTDFAAQESKQVSLEFQDWWYLNYWEIEEVSGLSEPIYRNVKTGERKKFSELFNLFQSERKTT